MDVRSADHTRFRGTDERDFSSLGRVMLVASHRTMRQALRQALEALGLEVTTDTPPGREALLAAVRERLGRFFGKGGGSVVDANLEVITEAYDNLIDVTAAIGIS